jgi:hypothetical protein
MPAVLSTLLRAGVPDLDETGAGGDLIQRLRIAPNGLNQGSELFVGEDGEDDWWDLMLFHEPYWNIKQRV